MENMKTYYAIIMYLYQCSYNMDLVKQTNVRLSGSQKIGSLFLTLYTLYLTEKLDIPRMQKKNQVWISEFVLQHI